MNYLEQIGKNAKKAFEDLKDVKHKKIEKVIQEFGEPTQYLLPDT